MAQKFTFLILLAMILTACSGKIIRQDQDGGVAKFEVGTQFQVHLDCPAEEGFYWDAIGINGHVIQQLGPPEIISSEQAKIPRKTYIFHFQTQNPGNALLKLILYGPGSIDDEPLDDFEIMITSGTMG